MESLKRKGRRKDRTPRKIHVLGNLVGLDNKARLNELVSAVCLQVTLTSLDHDVTDLDAKGGVL